MSNVPTAVGELAGKTKIVAAKVVCGHQEAISATAAGGTQVVRSKGSAR